MWLRRLALVLCCVPILGSSGPPSTGLEELVHRWLDAVGGDRNGRKVRSVVVRSITLEDGMTGRVEEWLDADSWRRVTTQSARTHEESCRDGACWVKDWNGSVLPLQGRDQDDQRTEATIEALLFGGAIRRITDEGAASLSGEDDSHANDILRVTPKGGLPFDLFLDKSTALPTRIVRKSYDDTITLQLSDWETVQGRKVPFSVLQTGGGGTDVKTTVVEVLPSRRPVAVPIGRPPEGPKDYRFANGRSALGIPFNFENDHIMVSARVNGSKPIWFMLDTGAEATIVNTSRIAELGVQPFGASSIRGGGNVTDFGFADVARLEVGGVTLLNQRDGVIDLSGLERIYGMPMGGLLGYDFFSRFVVRVNYDARTIDLLEPAPYAYEGEGAKVPFILEGRCPHVASTITLPPQTSIEADMIVDAGAADTVNLTSPFVKANRLLELARKKPAGAPNTMAGSEKEFFAQTSVRGRLGGITLSKITLKDIPVNLMVGTTGSYASESFSGTIGEGVLRRFTTIYDYSRGVMILEPNAEFGKPFAGRKTFGATLLSAGPDYTQFTVTAVRKDSPAEVAGLKKDDMIVAADGRPAAELRLVDLRKLLADEGTHHVLEILRGDSRATIEFDVTLLSLDES